MTKIRLPGRRKKKEVERVRVVNRLGDLKKWGLALITTGVLCVLMSTPFLWDKVSLRPGDVATEDIRAHQTVGYLDTTKTAFAQDEAALRIKRVYKEARYAGQDAQNYLQRVFEIAAEYDALRTYAPEARLRELRTRLSRIGIRITDPPLATLLNADAEGREEIRKVVSQLVEDAQGREIRNEGEDLKRARLDVHDKALQLKLPQQEVEAVAAISSAVLRPNRLYDDEATHRSREEARANVIPVYQDVKTGDLIVSRGTTVRQEHIDKLMALGLMHRSQGLVGILWSCVLTLGMVTLVGVYLYKFQKNVLVDTRLLLLFSLIVLVCVIGLKVSGTVLNLKLSSSQLSYLGMMWVAVGGMLTAVLLSTQLAIMLVAVLSVQGSLTLNNDLHFTAVAMASGLCGIFCVTNIRNRSDWLTTAGIVSGVNLLLVLVFGGMRGDGWREMTQGVIWAVSMGAASTLVFWFGVAILERPFGITTHIRLLELSDPNSPILRRLLMEAPGTYHHSIVVGNLAESAAEAVGADSMLVRVASYYHDIGKTRRPHYFVENQHVENVHDSMNPTLSTLVIISHVKDGVELGREFKLPPQIVELIGQHHGTSLVTYFYHQAAASESGAVMEEHFRYEGPKPQTREAAILMLADAVEAASRSIDKPTLNRIEGLVNKIVRDRQADGQLDECDLTFSDLDRIIGAFVRILVAMYHSRIEYPDAPVEAKKPNGEGNNSSESSGSAPSQEAIGRGGQKVPLS